MSAYVDPVLPVLAPLKSADISQLFGKQPGWFGTSRVRRRLYAKGFPHPIERGLWSAAAVRRWFDTAGENPNGEMPPHGRRRRRAPKAGRANAYAPVSAPGGSH